MANHKLMKSKWYPRPHNYQVKYSHGLETAANDRATIVPLAFYDEGLGAMSSYNSNPEHASFAETDNANCYPNSRVNNAFVELEFNLTKGALETDKIHALKCAFMPIFASYEDLDAKDELTGETLKTILEMQSESTDRQCYPLYNAVDMGAPYTDSHLLPTAQAGLTTTQHIEGVTFDPDTYYDALQYYTNADKLRSVTGGLHWFTLTKNKTYYKARIKLRSKSKRMVPYQSFNVLTYVPPVDTKYQIPTSGETTNIPHVVVTCTYRYDEWNEEFNHARQ